MTREEAILILGEFKEFCDGILWNSIYAERSRAIDMAIEALHREEAEEKGYCHRIKPKEYISADAVSREESEHLNKTFQNHDGEWIDITSIMSKPSDCVAVVRCKDCRWYKYDSYCSKTEGREIDADNFCSYGERREP